MTINYIRTYRGKHKIFIGMAPGVGKTYQMLEEGHRLRQEGTDVVVGLLETHNRQEKADAPFCSIHERVLVCVSKNKSIELMILNQSLLDRRKRNAKFNLQ